MAKKKEKPEIWSLYDSKYRTEEISEFINDLKKCIAKEEAVKAAARLAKMKEEREQEKKNYRFFFGKKPIRKKKFLKIKSEDKVDDAKEDIIKEDTKKKKRFDDEDFLEKIDYVSKKKKKDWEEVMEKRAEYYEELKYDYIRVKPTLKEKIKSETKHQDIFDAFEDHKEKFILWRISTPRFKPWRFKTQSEVHLWSFLNSFWNIIENEFRFVRFSHLIGKTSKDDVNIYDEETEDLLLYDTEFFSTYQGVDTIFPDEDHEEDFSRIFVPDNHEEFTEESYDVGWLIFLIFGLFFEFFFGGIFLWFWLVWNFHEEEFSPDDEEMREDPTMETDDLAIDNIYNSYLEFTGYYLEPYNKPIYSKKCIDTIFSWNTKYLYNLFFFNKLKIKKKINKKKKIKYL